MNIITNNADPVIVETSFEASVAAMWNALTALDKLKKWYFDISDFKPQVGFEFEFNGGSEAQIYVHKCRVTLAEAPHKLAYTWCYENYEGNSLLTFELFEEGPSQTRLKLTHTGLESFPHQPDFARSSFQAGWDYIINTSLKSFIEGK